MVQEPAEAEEYRSVSVDIGGIQRLLDLSTTALRDKGIVRARYSLERTSALYLLALCMLKSQDRETAIPHFLEAALPLLASSQMEQDVPIPALPAAGSREHRSAHLLHGWRA